MIIRELHGYKELEQLSNCFAETWRSPDSEVVAKETLVAAELCGHQLLGAFENETLIGGSWDFLTLENDQLNLHSHITGVLPTYEGTGVGYELKMEQKRWCLDRGIETVTWTFDPMITRNAAFNLRKLGAKAIAYLDDFYGEMNDQYNSGEPTDRLEAVWNLRSAPMQPSSRAVTVFVPTDPSAARNERERIRMQMHELFAQGLQAIWFDNDRGYFFE
ncbi:MAG: hypothetical protein ACYDCC_07415 [Actinomycetota bacterium]